jgi:hypothetical protein
VAVPRVTIGIPAGRASSLWSNRTGLEGTEGFIEVKAPDPADLESTTNSRMLEYPVEREAMHAEECSRLAKVYVPRFRARFIKSLGAFDIRLEHAL